MDKQDKFITEVRQILEANTSWLEVQIAVMYSILDDPQIQVLGKSKVPNWDSLDKKQQASVIFTNLGEDTLKKARNYMLNSPDIKPGTETDKNTGELKQNVFDVADIEEPRDGIESVHAEQMKNSRMFKDLQQLFLQGV